MKHTMLLLLLVLTLFAFPSTSASAKSANAALVVNLDQGCHWWLWDGVQWIEVTGSVLYAGTQNGKWHMSCHGSFQLDPPLKMALEYRSTPENPWLLCTTPFGQTYDTFANFTPSGRSVFVCKGDLTP